MRLIILIFSIKSLKLRGITPQGRVTSLSDSPTSWSDNVALSEKIADRKL
jgi:hypothetical protein